MTGPGVSGDDMPIFASQSQPESAPAQNAALDALLAGTEPPADGATGLQPVADALAALRAGPAGGELAGEMAALARFRQQFGAPARPLLSCRRRPRMLPVLLSQKAAVVAVAAAVALGGVVGVAHALVGGGHGQGVRAHLARSPSPTQHDPGRHGTGHLRVGPLAVHHVGQQALARLCSRYEQPPGHGREAGRSVALGELGHAAGGNEKVGRFCASLVHLRPPRTPGHPGGGSSQHGSGHGKGGGSAGGDGGGNGQGKASSQGGGTQSGSAGNGGGSSGGNRSGGSSGSGRGGGSGGETATGMAPGTRPAAVTRERPCRDAFPHRHGPHRHGPASPAGR